mgnify:CR=1 FL=1
MNLSVDYLDNKIVFANEYINAVEIENKRYFYRFVNDLYSVYINGYSDNLKFIQDNKEINMNGKIKVFINYFDFQFDSKKYTSEISKFVSNYINEEDTKNLINLYGKMTRIYKKALIDIDLPLYVENDISIDNINKLIKLGISPKEELLDNLMLLIDLEHTLKTNNFLVFVNLKQYLTKDEVVELYKYAIYNEITIMLVDSICHGANLKNEKKYIIDENLDELML